MCLSNQFLLNQCCAPSTVQFANVQTFLGEKKSLNVSNVKLLSNFFFQRFMGFFMPFCFQALIKGKIYIYLLVFYILLLETIPKTQNTSKFTKEQDLFAKWTIDGVQHQFNKNWLGRQKLGFLRNT